MYKKITFQDYLTVGFSVNIQKEKNLSFFYTGLSSD